MPDLLLRTLKAWLWPAAIIAVPVFAVALAVIVGRLILGPLQKAARRRGQPTQFYLTDFVWLLIQLQAALGLVSAFVARNPAWAFYLVLGFLGGALTAMWWGALRALSQAGVRSTLRRAVLILVLLPAVEVTLFAVMAMGGAGPIFLWRALRGELLRADLTILGALAMGGGALVLAVAAVVAVCVLLRMLTFWLLAGAEPSPSNAETS